MPQSMPVLVKLPREQLRAAFEIVPEMKRSVRLQLVNWRGGSIPADISAEIQSDPDRDAKRKAKEDSVAEESTSVKTEPCDT